MDFQDKFRFTLSEKRQWMLNILSEGEEAWKTLTRKERGEFHLEFSEHLQNVVDYFLDYGRPASTSPPEVLDCLTQAQYHYLLSEASQLEEDIDIEDMQFLKKFLYDPVALQPQNMHMFADLLAISFRNNPIKQKYLWIMRAILQERRSAAEAFQQNPESKFTFMKERKN